jgi:hypothetical protein
VDEFGVETFAPQTINEAEKQGKTNFFNFSERFLKTNLNNLTS